MKFFKYIKYSLAKKNTKRQDEIQRILKESGIEFGIEYDRKDGEK